MYLGLATWIYSCLFWVVEDVDQLENLIGYSSIVTIIWLRFLSNSKLTKVDIINWLFNHGKWVCDV